MNIIICIVVTFPAHPSLSRMTTYCRVYYSDNDSDNDSDYDSFFDDDTEDDNNNDKGNDGNEDSSPTCGVPTVHDSCKKDNKIFWI